MAATRGQRRSRMVAWLALGLVAGATAVGFASNGREGPPSAARDRETAAAAVRLALGRPLALGGQPASHPVPLLPDARQVVTAGHATRVRIATVGIDAEVRQVGYTLLNGQLEYDTPRFEAGQFAGSADPGTPGNLVIGGHVSNRGAVGVFRRLPEVGIGDVVEVFSGEVLHRYSVTELRVVAPEATAVMAGTQEATLTLITCSPNQNHRDRVVVIGKLL